MPATRTRSARRRPGGVNAFRIQRSLRAMTVNTQLALQERQQQQHEIEAGETEQQFKLEISGLAGVRVKWRSVAITFDYPFIAAPDRRDSTLDRPIFTCGFEMQSAEPVILSATVKGWHQGRDVGVITGADVWVGAVAPGVKKAVKFRGTLHVVFQGFAQPYVEDDDEVS